MSFLQIADRLRAVVAGTSRPALSSASRPSAERRDIDHQVFAARQELVQRRIERADGDRESVHRAEDADEIVALHGQQFLQRRAAILFVVGQNHGAHVRNLLLAEEHVLGAAQADAFCAERARLDRIARNVSIGANSHACGTDRPIP